MKTTILEMLREIPDYRKGNAIRHNLVDILMIGLLCVICNGNSFADMALFGEIHKEILKEFLELPFGIPSHDTFENVFAKLDSKLLSKQFQLWIEELKEMLKSTTISIDGKTIRRSKSVDKKAVHVVTAFASEMQIVLGQISTDEKSNEITAIPKLLDMFCVKGNIITIDAMGTQTAIATKIIEKEGDYVLDLKGNHPNLHKDVKDYLDTEVIAGNRQELVNNSQYYKTLEQGHGRIETRECFISTEISWLESKENWDGLAGVGVIISKREEIGKEPTISHNYFIFSLKDATAEELLRVKRSHWSIENQLHWTLDVTFREDECRARLDNAAENMNILRKQALQLMKDETTVKGSLRSKRLRCAYNIFYALLVVGVK